MNPTILDTLTAALTRTHQHLTTRTLHQAHQLAHDWQLPPTPTTTNSSRTGQPSDPTGRQATNPTPTDPTHHILTDAITTAITALTHLNALTATIHHTTGPDANRRHHQANLAYEPTCASILCNDTATHGPHCQPCHDWLTEHPDVRQVPRHLIATRQRVRNHRAATTPPDAT